MAADSDNVPGASSAEPSGPRLTAVVAVDRELAIGKDGDLPWHLPADLKRFKALTMGCPIIMGRATHESIGKPLPGRRNIVLSRNPSFEAEGCSVFSSVPEALDAVADEREVFVIGGAALYEATLNRLHRLNLTVVDGTFDGDTFFPPFDLTEWTIAEQTVYEPDEKNAWRQVVTVLDRQPSRRAPKQPVGQGHPLPAVLLGE